MTPRMDKIAFLSFLMTASLAPASAQSSQHKWAVVIHGGAGTIARPSSNEAAYRESLRKALETAAEVLNNGGSSLDAVEALVGSIKTM